MEIDGLPMHQARRFRFMDYFVGQTKGRSANNLNISRHDGKYNVTFIDADSNSLLFAVSRSPKVFLASLGMTLPRVLVFLRAKSRLICGPIWVRHMTNGGG
jgi:hypothetical protein